MSETVTGEPPDKKQELASDSAEETADKKAANARAERVERPFPRRSLEEALRVPKAIRDGNGGNAWAAEQVATALHIGAKSSNLKILLAAAADFGLTTGKSPTAQIALTDLGRDAVYPSSAESEAAAVREAFNRIDVFRKVLEHYGGNNLPERQFLDNTLQKDYGLHRDALDEFVDLFEKNCRTAKIGKELPAADTAASSTNGQSTAVVSTATPKAKAGSRPVCFIIMPFTERHDDHEVGFFTEVLEQLFNPALEAAGFEPRTALQQGSDVIQATIVNALLDADMVLADLTEHNPNVLFELGMRMHTEKPVALVRAKGTGKVFDVDNMLRVVDYNPNLWPSTVKKDLPAITKHVKATWDNRGKAKTFMQILADTPVAVPVA
jgi:nucleoside 2-deoxyribosyltransferase